MEWKIAIAGDDKEPYKAKVSDLIKESGLEGRVDLLGCRSDIFDLMAKSSVYAMSSRIEGFSLALVEAISQGCASVAFANHGVMNEVSCGGKGVRIVEDHNVEAFSQALAMLMADERLRKSVAEEGKACVKEYSLGAIVDKWENLLCCLVHHNTK